MNMPRIAQCFPRKLALGCAVAALSAAAPSFAAPIVFFGLDNSFMPNPRTNADAARNAFVGAVGASTITTQDFETAALGDFAPVTTGTLANGVGVTVVNSATEYMRLATGIGTFNTYPTSGARYVEALSDPGSTYFTATFDQPVRGIGFYLTDVSDWCCGAQGIGELRVVLTTGSGSSVRDLTPEFDPVNLVDGNVAFFGIFDDAAPFTSIAIRSDANIPDEDAIGIDDFMVSIQAVPAPGTLALMLGLLPVLGFVRRPRLAAGFAEPIYRDLSCGRGCAGHSDPSSFLRIDQKP